MTGTLVAILSGKKRRNESDEILCRRPCVLIDVFCFCVQLAVVVHTVANAFQDIQTSLDYRFFCFVLPLFTTPF